MPIWLLNMSSYKLHETMTAEILDSFCYKLIDEMCVGVGKLCWHNFEHNRYVQAFENYASIIGINWHNFENLGHTIAIK